ncbi:NmrA family NAD(P)-binding protein [Amycolatopsis cynarae]|uniref:NmrA family NAD(P)-binding protein n=1 Tax=Amycolatopsis cynarae TaxID=2995223 RepID=A0ABY7B296_9PSEU|nr:NmrA family NAD(P)-binding protein [Amycolatopsis sp. HUAS 11-8]WAL66422.1 NmrA family NAD(P)-binding protein [Amycolatopsis sp. HUAS 11-8]
MGEKTAMILVFGAGGTVGSAVLGELNARGRPARAACHRPERTSQALARGQDAVTVDLDRPETIRPALDGVDTVFLLGAMGPHQSAQETAAVTAAIGAGVRRIVKLSVWRADEGLTPIARLHRPVEELLESAGVAWTFLRPNFFMQNFSRQLAPAIRSGGAFGQPVARAPISFVDARDVARAAARTLVEEGHEARTYRLTGPAALTYEDAAEVLSRVLRRPVRYLSLSDVEARAAMTGAGMSDFHADALIEVSQAYRDGGADAVTTDVEVLTGSPPTAFDRFVAEHREVFAPV